MSTDAKTNPPPTLSFRPGDERLCWKDLLRVSLFDSLQPKPSLETFFGSVVLRRYKRGETIVKQGEAGWTAFYILTSDDLLTLRREQLKRVKVRLARIGEATAERFQRSSKDKNEQVIAARQRLEEIEELVKEAETLATGAESGDGSAQRKPVCTAHLEVNLQSRPQPPGFLRRWTEKWRRRTIAPDTELPESIPSDGPADIDTRTLSAAMFEGELFGEISCLERIPRSSTVRADRDCYMLEIMRNIFDRHIRRDKGFKKKSDETYRDRVLALHLKHLPIFAALNDDQLSEVKQRVELVSFVPGEVIIDEHDTPADSVYVLRKGIVKIVKNFPGLVSHADLVGPRCTVLLSELRACGACSDWKQKLWLSLPASIRDLAKLNPEQELSPSQCRHFADHLNQFIKAAGFVDSLGKKTHEVLATLPANIFSHASTDIAAFPNATKDWSSSDVRLFNRLLLEEVCPAGMPRRGPRRVLAYRGRGDVIGEGGVLLDRPRSATAIAYNHPDNGQADPLAMAEPSDVDLVRIPASEVRRIVERSTELSKHLVGIAEARERETDDRMRSSAWGESPVWIDPEFEASGFVQGQHLMLIDLDRCTRCGECVRACIDAHDDGRSRLYLDGPRFGKYLSPTTCRSCLDPVCMIGCPVGSIVRGDSGEILIKDWCIGCGLCARQCPYGAIHIHTLLDRDVRPAVPPIPPDLAELIPALNVRKASERAVVCDLCSSLPSKTPQCVYHCPHDAAIRINAREEFPQR